jgi:NADH dehydrogenase FAD-containing subunit
VLIAPTTPCPDFAECASSHDTVNAMPLRERVRAALERAASAGDAGEQRRLLTFVVIGAGRTGVALAGSLAELLGEHRNSAYQLDPAIARVVLVDGSIRVLPGWARSLSSAARDALKRLGVELRLGVPVSEVDAGGIVLAGKRIPSATVLWGGSDEPRGSRFAPICRGFAVAELGWLRLSGSPAWLAWRVATAFQRAALARPGAPAVGWSPGFAAQPGWR